MSDVLARVQVLVERGEVEPTLHGFRELAADNILLEDVVSGVGSAMVVEDYPAAGRGPCVLVLQRDKHFNPLHILWGIPKHESSPAVIITAYRPDPERWFADFTERRRR